MYRHSVEVAGGLRVEVEILAHRFAWESYHSELNQAGGAYIPSRCFSEAFDLRGIPQSFDQTAADGARASISVSAPSGFTGRLLYLREDLLKKYAGGRRLIWFLWGERTLYGYLHSPPEWLTKVHRDRTMIWRRVVMGEDLSSAFRKTVSTRARRPKKRSSRTSP